MKRRKCPYCSRPAKRRLDGWAPRFCGFHANAWVLWVLLGKQANFVDFAATRVRPVEEET